MSEKFHYSARIVSVVAATAISLACGTNYAYSAWAPQFAERMKLSATESNLIGVAGNIGMYASGIPVGVLVDGYTRGPRIALLLGASSLGLGYYPIYRAYEEGPGYLSVGVLSFFCFLTGFGSCSSFSASIKISALNWPDHRGTATAFPLSGFGLSALFFTSLAGILFPDDTAQMLFTLSVGTFCIIFFCSFFLRVIPNPPAYAAVPTSEEAIVESTSASRPKSAPAKAAASGSETDISGLALLYKLDFWLLFLMMSLLAGVGLMTINNIGHDAQALWGDYDPSATKRFVTQQQMMQVSIISFMSFSGRLLSGIGSDVLVKRLRKSRFWCLVASSAVFTLAQLMALVLTNPSHLWLLSTLTGLGYGALFGVFPALTADAFGVSGLSLNWGAMTMAPVLSGNVYNMCYGAIFDDNSEIIEGERVCELGIDCYRTAYLVTLASACVGVVVSLYTVRRHSRAKEATDIEFDTHQA